MRSWYRTRRFYNWIHFVIKDQLHPVPISFIFSQLWLSPKTFCFRPISARSQQRSAENCQRCFCNTLMSQFRFMIFCKKSEKWLFCCICIKWFFWQRLIAWKWQQFGIAWKSNKKWSSFDFDKPAPLCTNCKCYHWKKYKQLFLLVRILEWNHKCIYYLTLSLTCHVSGY